MITLATTRRRLPALVGEVGVAVFMAALTVGGAIGESHPNQPTDKVVYGHLTPVAPWPAYLLVAAAALVLIWRHRRPAAVLTGSLLAVLIYTALGYVNGAALLNPVIALYAVAAAPRSVPRPGGPRAGRQPVAAAVATLLALLGITAAFNPFGAFGGSFVLIPGLVAAALFAGLAVANRRAYIEAIQQRAALAERTREDEARRRVDVERLRIARELHDVIAHTMSTINVQAGVAVHVSKDLPEPAAAALRAIRDASKNGLRELRAILNVLRQADETDPRDPTPSLADLGALITTVQQAGLPAELAIGGQPRTLPAAVELAGYRIVQESLTNTIRHAGPATASVSLDYGQQQLRIAVADTGTGTGAATGSDNPGHGLLGMRERATALGGTFHAGPTTRGGFQVAACLPIEPSR